MSAARGEAGQARWSRARRARQCRMGGPSAPRQGRGHGEVRRGEAPERRGGYGSGSRMGGGDTDAVDTVLEERRRKARRAYARRKEAKMRAEEGGEEQRERRVSELGGA